jgi:hypothetical protein
MICRIQSNSIQRVLFTLIFCGLFANFANAQEPDPRELLKRMSDEIAGLQSYIINGEAYSDARLDAGLIIEHSAQATLRIRKVVQNVAGPQVQIASQASVGVPGDAEGGVCIAICA